MRKLWDPIVLIPLVICGFFFSVGYLDDSIPRNTVEPYVVVARVVGVQKITRTETKAYGEIPTTAVAAGVRQNQTKQGLEQITLGYSICEVIAAHSEGLIVRQFKGVEKYGVVIPQLCVPELVGVLKRFTLRDEYAGDKYIGTTVLGME